MITELPFVEFIGLPGSGKTTIVRKITKRLKSENCDIYSLEMLERYRSEQNPIKRGISLLTFIISHLPLVINCIRYGLSFRPINFTSLRFSYKAVRTAFKSKQAITNAAKEGYPLVVFDQGFLQDLWSVGVTGDAKDLYEINKSIFRIVKSVYSEIIALVVFVDVEPLQATGRIQCREVSPYRFDNMKRSSVVNILNAKESFLKTILDVILNLNSVRGLIQENNGRISDAQIGCLIESIRRETEYSVAIRACNVKFV